ncbi:RNA methyltransferase [Yoonia sp. BS5-3]|uniref:TrmH family RNA methyltransferase n=1 Tax=Yoonia phaeophyticola TaxID=3137369 RepID=A0ABZ2V6Z3_9RHOB
MAANSVKESSISWTKAAALKDARQVRNKLSFRNQRGQFFIEGVRNFVRAHDNRFVIDCVIYSEKLLINPLARKLVRRRKRDGIPTFSVSPEAFRKLSTAKRASGVCALLRQRWTRFEDLPPKQQMCWTVLERVQSEGNFGTLIRSSSAAGAAGFILVGDHVDPYAPAVIRSSMGAVFQQAFIRTDWDTLRHWVAQTGNPVIGATPDAETGLYEFACPTGTPLLMFGEERHGLSHQQTALCTNLVSIPMCEGTDSLNLGVAGSLLLYEVRRQRYNAKAI